MVRAEAALEGEAVGVGGAAIVARGHLEGMSPSARLLQPQRLRRFDHDANVITPPSTVAALRAGYPLQIDDAALVSRSSSRRLLSTPPE